MYKYFKKNLIIAASILIPFLLTPLVGQADTLTLKFGLYGSERRSSLDEQFNPILTELENRLSSSMGKKVEIERVFFRYYQQGLDAIVNGDVDFTRTGPATYALAKQRNNELSIIAVESKKGKKTFEGVIVAGKNSDITEVSDIKNKSFAFGNENSTIGRYLSQLRLLGAGITADDLAKYDYLGQHDKVAVSVLRNQYDAGAFKSGILKDKYIADRVKVIAKINTPTHPWTAREGLTKETINHIKEALLGITDKSVLKGLKRDGFLAGDDSDYATMREAIEKNPLFFNKQHAAASDAD